MLKDDFCVLYENKAKGAIIRSKTKWIEQGKKPNKYYFLIRKKGIITVRSSRPDARLICDELELLKKIEMYFRNLY